ncbi:MAG: PspC domain-containing protein [bacterium]|nr:PspC domain-containing protein [bacterium]
MIMKRLYKSKQNKMISGVCGGVAEYLGIDPTIVRIGFMILSSLAGSGLMMYIIASILIPEQPTETFRSFYDEQTDSQDDSSFYQQKHF